VNEPWEKFPGNPILGGALGSCFDISIARVADGYRMWFSWRPRRGIGLAESRDGLVWTARPDVVLGPDGRDAEECREVSRPYVLLDDGHHTMWYAGHGEDRVVIRRATSSDGVAWERSGTVLEPVVAWEKAAVMCPSVLRDDDGRYHLWYSGGERYEPDAVGYAISDDGIRWRRVRDVPVLRPDPANDWERDRVTGAHVFRHEGWLYAAYIGFADGFEKSAIGIARSPDGVRWERHAGNPVITPGPAGAFDAINVYKPFVLVEEALWRMWFNASAPLSGDNTEPDNRIEQIGYASCRFAFQPAAGQQT
jgi:beta-1,4-mannooligosaccharide phosphorylase